MARKRSFLLTLVLLVVLIGGSVPAGAGAATTPTQQQQLQQLMQFWNGVGNTASFLGMMGYQKSLLAKAQPDECYKSPGDSIFPWDFQKQGACPAGYVPKTNDAYTWGLAKYGTRVWWGTGPNILCGVLSGYLGQTTPIQTADYACEFGQSKYGKFTPTGPGSDFRPSHMYYYDLSTKKQVEVTPTGDSLHPYLLGVRSGGSFNDVVLLGGPDALGGISLFAFQSSTGQFLKSQHFAQYTNIRKWVVVDGALYTGVRNNPKYKDASGNPMPNSTGGSILRWNGSVSDPFNLEVVGSVTSEPAELAAHQGRLFVSTWPAQEMASVWMSPTIPAGGLRNANANQWARVWKASDYDPDPLVAATYGGGALASFGGYLYWGTMHVPGVAAETFLAAHYPQGTTPTQVDALAAFNGTHRAITIFRGKDFGMTTQKEEVVYGESSLQAYSETAKAWQSTPTKMGAPLFGHSGFGNTFNNYTWTMQVFGGQLYVGTMDWSYLIKDYLPIYMLLACGEPFTQAIPAYQGTYGADLIRFRSTTEPAIMVSANGVGNNLNYGIRTMLADGTDLFIGTANPMNLRTNPTGQLGGWELYQLKDPPAYLK